MAVIKEKSPITLAEAIRIGCNAKQKPNNPACSWPDCSCWRADVPIAVEAVFKFFFGVIS
jgi:hypothetical protein